MEKKNVSGKRILTISILIVAWLCPTSKVSRVPQYDSINVSSFSIELGQPGILTVSVPGYKNIHI